MVSWGLGHNLEKNLQKARALRDRGDLARALELLQAWAEKHEDTPHYYYEAALVAFELEDPTSGIHALKTLLRRFPDTREKILGACADQYRDHPSLALGEFLVEHHLASRRFDEAVETIDALTAEDARIFAKRVRMRHQSLQATPNTPEPKLQQVESARLMAAHAVEDAALFLDATRALLALGPELHEDVAALGEKEGPDRRPPIRFALGCCHRAAGDVAAASRAWVQAARADATLLEPARECLTDCEPDDDERGEWLAARGRVDLLGGDMAAAEENLRRAGEADPSLREGVLEDLDAAEESTDDGLTEGLSRLRLRLLVVLDRHDEAARYSRRLLESERVSAHDVRRLMGEGKEGDQDTGLRVALAEAAIRDHDLAAAAAQANDLPDSEGDSLRRLVDALEEVRDQWDPDTLQPLLSLAAVLSSRAREEERANRHLESMWAQAQIDAEAGLPVTMRCLETIRPSRELLGRAFASLLDAGLGEGTHRLVVSLFGHGESGPAADTPDAGGFQTVDFGGSDAIDFDLDLGELQQDVSEDLAGAFLAVLEEKPERATLLLEVLDRAPSELNLHQKLRHPIAYAALLARDYDRALGEFTVLQVTAGEETTARLHDYLLEAVDADPEATSVRIALADLQADQGRWLESAQQLAESLRRTPGRSEEVCRHFDALLGRAPADEIGPLWTLYAEALFDAGRFDQLREVCRRGIECGDRSAIARLKLLAIRVMVEEGRLSEALSALQGQLDHEHGDVGRLIEILEAILRAHPGSAAAHFLLGVARHRAGQPVAALDSWTRAAEADEKLAPRVDEKLEQLQAHASVGGDELFAIAEYHRHRDRLPEAAALYERTVRLEPELAGRILGELEDLLHQKEADLDLLLALASAARVDGRVQLGCDLLSRVDQGDPARIEPVLTGFRQLRESAPDDLRPVGAVARVLLRHRMQDAAGRTVAECGRDERFELTDRVTMLEEFHRRCPDDPRLALVYADLLGRSGRVDAAAEILETPAIQVGVDAPAAARVVESLRETEPGRARLGLLHHDFLLRSGRIDEALGVLPEPESLDAATLVEVVDRLETQREVALQHEDLASRLGRALWTQGRHVDALETLETAIERLRPEAASPLRWDLVHLLTMSGRGQESRRVLDLDQADAQQRRRAFARLGESNVERLEAEIASLQDQWERHPGAAHLAFRLADRLLARGRAHEAEDLLRRLDCDDDERGQRALLLARARCELGRIDRAETALRQIDWNRCPDRQRHEAFRRMAHCAGLLGRHAEATARWQQLQQEFDDPTFRSTSREEYSHDLADAAGSHRALLVGVGTLDDEHSPLQEQS